MPRAWPGSPDVRAKTRSWVARCTPVLNRLAPLMTQPSPSATARVSSQVASEPWFGLGQPERHRPLAGDQRLGPLLLLRVGAEPVHHDDLREVADDRRLVLQVVVQPEALVRQVFPDDRHVDVGAVAAAELRRQAVAQPARLVGALAHLAEQVLPLPRCGMPPLSQSVRAFSRRWSKYWMCLAFQRFDLGLDERVHLGEHSRKMLGEGEIHGDSSSVVVRTRTASSSKSSTASRWRRRR